MAEWATITARDAAGTAHRRTAHVTGRIVPT